jgi:hypothetical protein
VYYAVMGMHSASSVLVDWHREHAADLRLPPIYDTDEVVTSFAGAGFDVAASRLKVGFIPMADAPPRVMACLSTTTGPRCSCGLPGPERPDLAISLRGQVDLQSPYSLEHCST